MTGLSPDIDLDLLPGNVREIAGIIGLPATLKLVEHFGGTRTWVPGKLIKSHPIVKAIGVNRARQLIEHFGSERIDIPKCDAALRTLPDAEIIQKLKTEKRADVAREYGLTERRVYMIQTQDHDSDQLQLL